MILEINTYNKANPLERYSMIFETSGPSGIYYRTDRSGAPASLRIDNGENLLYPIEKDEDSDISSIVINGIVVWTKSFSKRQRHSRPKEG